MRLSKNHHEDNCPSILFSIIWSSIVKDGGCIEGFASLSLGDYHVEIASPLKCFSSEMTRVEKTVSNTFDKTHLLQVLAIVFIRKLLDNFFSQLEMGALDDVLPEAQKKQKIEEEAMNKEQEEEVRGHEFLIAYKS